MRSCRRRHENLAALPAGAVVGTSSLRRAGADRRALSRSSRSGRCAATSTRASPSSTAATTRRSCWRRRASSAWGWGAHPRYLSIEESLPAAGQAALGIECLAARADVAALARAARAMPAPRPACAPSARSTGRSAAVARFRWARYAEIAGRQAAPARAGRVARRQAHRARRRRGRCRAARRARPARRRGAARAGRRGDPRCAGTMSGAACGPARPRHAARSRPQTLERLVRDAGGEPVCVPAIEIRDLDDLAPFHALADRLESFDLAIFVSRNAVRTALRSARRQAVAGAPAGRRRSGKAAARSSRARLCRRHRAGRRSPTARRCSRCRSLPPCAAGGS